MERFVSKQELLNWACEMIKIPSYPGIEAQEMAVAQYIKGVFDAEGIECEIHPLDQGRANVVAYLRGTGGGKSLLLNGHTDTVPPYDMEDPCEPRIENGRLRGRGSTDMKSQLACMMACMIAIKRSGVPLRGDLIFTGVADEECGSLGCIDLIQRGIRADAAIVCEGLGVQNIAVAQKGLEWYAVDFYGKTVHGGSQDEGVNSILLATRYIDALMKELDPLLQERRHPHLDRSTMNVAVVQGGTQPSTVAGYCHLELDRRFLPVGETYEGCTGELQALLDKLSAEDPDFKAVLSVLPSSVMKDGFVHQGYETDENCDLVQSCVRSVQAVTGKPAVLMGCPCWTDAGLLAYYGKMPVVVHGPGEVAVAHSARESIDLEEMLRGAKSFLAIARDFCG